MTEGFVQDIRYPLLKKQNSLVNTVPEFLPELILVCCLYKTVLKFSPDISRIEYFHNKMYSHNIIIDKIYKSLLQDIYATAKRL